MGFSRQGYWSGLPFSSPGDLRDPRIEPGSPVLQADSLPSELREQLKQRMGVGGRHVPPPTQEGPEGYFLVTSSAPPYLSLVLLSTANWHFLSTYLFGTPLQAKVGIREVSTSAINEHI